MLSTVTVDTHLDAVDFTDGVTSLREALFATNLVGGVDTIDFDASLDGETILLTMGELEITDDLTIDASSLPGGLAIDAAGNDPTPDEDNRDGSRILMINDGDFAATIQVELIGLTLTGGDVSGSGGAIYSFEQLTIIDSTIIDNTASQAGGIFAFGNLTIEESTITENNAIGSAGVGGGISSLNANVSIIDSTVLDNVATIDGGGVSSHGSLNSLEIVGSTISGNVAGDDGGGIETSVATVITGSTISENTAADEGGGIRVENSIEIYQSTIADNSAGERVGGGILADFADIYIEGSTISGNTAVSQGGGIFAYASSTTIIDSTISSNSVSRNEPGDGGGGLWLGGSVAFTSVVNSTIANNMANSGGGGGIWNGSPIEIIGSTITGNSALSGGGVWTYNSFTSIFGSTLSSNAALATSSTDGGGGIWANDFTHIYDSTLSNNTAANKGGGFLTFGDALIEGSTFSVNSAEVEGGGVYTANFRSLTMFDSVVTGNSVGSSGFGGGISSRATELTISGTIISDNTSGEDGGGIYSTAITTITETTIASNTSDNSGGGIRHASTSRSLTISDSDISNNVAGSEGGGIHTSGGATITITVIANNSADSSGGGILASNTTTIEESTISGNTSGGLGGGIRHANYLRSLTVTNSDISKNHSEFSGGGIETNGSTWIIGTIVSNNTSASSGGGIFARGTTAIRESKISGNTALDGWGGGVSFVNSFDSLSITDSTISGNKSSEGGGGLNVNNYRSAATITGSTISGNTSGAEGGGVKIDSRDSPTTIADSSISGNTSSGAGGGVHLFIRYDAATISGSTIAENTAEGNGGGVYVGGAFAEGHTTIDASTISENTSLRNGGGLWTDDPATITSSTISGNFAVISGGGIHTSNNTTIGFSTISDNSADTGGGLFVASGTATLNHAIVADNDADSFGPDLTGLLGVVLELHYSLVGNSSSSGLTPAPVGSPDASGNLIGPAGFGQIDPRLAALANNGGRTRTHALLADSPAIDAGDPGVVSPPANDQRGDPFARIVGAAIDMGAYERQDFGGPQTWIVDTLGDATNSNYSAGDLTLREAIGLANSNGDLADTINFDPSLAGATIILRQGELEVRDPVTIDASHLTGGVTIDASDNDPTPDENLGDGSRVLDIGIDNSLFSPVSIDVRLKGLTLTGGDVDGGGGAIHASGGVTIDASTISENSASGNGGGVWWTGDLVVTGSTISGNYAGFSGGGGHGYILSMLSMTNSTISGNAAAGSGGGLAQTAFGILPFTVAHSTISGNLADADEDGSGVGGGIANTASLQLEHTIVAGNLRSEGVRDDINSFFIPVEASYSLIGDNAGAAITDNGGNLIGTSEAPIDPLLGPLTDNGGPTMTHALLAGSPAIDAGDPDAEAGMDDVPLYDQRGFAFSRIVGERIDIGAYESGAVSADFDKGYAVTGLDFLVWQRGFGTPARDAEPTDGDSDFDLDVDEDDFSAWESQFGLTFAAPPSTATEEAPAAAELVASPSSAGEAPSLLPAPLIVDLAQPLRKQTVNTDPVEVEQTPIEAARDHFFQKLGLQSRSTLARRTVLSELVFLDFRGREDSVTDEAFAGLDGQVLSRTLLRAM